MRITIATNRRAAELVAKCPGDKLIERVFTNETRILSRGRNISGRVSVDAATVLAKARPGDRVMLPVYLERNGLKFMAGIDQGPCCCVAIARKRRIANVLATTSYFHTACPVRHEVAMATIVAVVEAIEYTEAAA